MQAIATSARHDVADPASTVEHPPRVPRPAAGEVHLWFATGLGGDADEIAVAVLDDGERGRAERVRSERDRARFIAHHVFMRRVLAGYLGMAPVDVPIRTAITGKPETDPRSGISFNTSRSGGLSAVAVACAPVGVDIERLRPIDDALEVADGLFTEGERRELGALTGVARSAAFLALWTRKEAVVKAVGSGLSQPLDAFDVSEGAEGPVGRWHSRLGATGLVVAMLDAPSGWVGAVSVVGTRLELHVMDATVLPS